MRTKALNIDCMDFMAGLPDNAYELAIVDPPYGLGGRVVNSCGRFKGYYNNNGNWDEEPPSQNYFTELFRVSKNQIIWGGNYFNLPPNRCFLIWDKKQPEGISFGMAEYAWASFNSVSKVFYQFSSHVTQGKRIHPTQKPIALYRWLLTNYAKPGDRILDTHLGSGSSRIAAEELGFEFVGCELDEDYYNDQEKRFNAWYAQGNLFREEQSTEKTEQISIFDYGKAAVSK